MKFILLPAWAALALAGGIYAAPPSAATVPAAPAPALPAIPSRLMAAGRVQPIGSQVQLSWLPASRAQSYKVYRDGQLLASTPGTSWTDYAVSAGETHAYTVTGLNTGGESRPSSAASATVPAGGGSVIYADSLVNGWQSWSWAGTDLSSTSPAHAGSAIRVTAGPWQALYLHHTPFSASPYSAVTFWINGGSAGGQRLMVRALRSGTPQTAVPLAPLAAGQWQSVTIPLSSLGVAAAPDMDGLWVQDSSGTAQPAFSVDEIALKAAPAAPAVPPAPAAPAGLSATPQWATACPKCGGMAMAHIVLAWNAVPGASSYTVYRGGVKAQDGLTSPGWVDMTVTSGQTYSYTVSATGPGGEGQRSAPATATAPNPPGAIMTAPVNLRVQGLWQGISTDSLTWSPAPGAVSYNVYQYTTQIAQGLTTTSYAVPTSVYYSGMTYSVTAVDAMGMESLPSAIVTAQGSDNPASAPGWMPPAPPPPTALAATPEWNAGAPRVHLTWQGNSMDYTYTVYRDGQKVADNLWGLNYFDQSVQAGETHSYAVSSVNVPWVTAVESLPSSPVTATAPSAAPVATGTPVQITGVKADDDSAVVSFAAVPGALDYRVYDVTKPNSVKYSGGSLSIEMNGLDPAAGADLVVEAVDKFGPFQTMDGMAGPGAMQMDGMHSAINGQGDPSDIPIVLAASAPVHVTCQPCTLAGSQVFLDTFRNEQPLVLQPMPAPVSGTWYGQPGGFAEFQNDKWTVRNYGGDLLNTKIFFMGNHFMDTFYDGGTPGTNLPAHQNNASLVMMPKATADISGGKVLHVTFEVDAHTGGRRWMDVFVAPANDLLTDPGKFSDFPDRRPTTSGQLFRWEIQGLEHILSLFPGIKPDAFTDMVNITQEKDGVGADNFDLCVRAGNYAKAVLPGGNGQALNNGGDTRHTFNGSPGDLDKRHKFDLYLSKNRVVIMEAGVVVKDTVFPNGYGLPFDKCQVYFVHQVYHTQNDRQELLDFGNGSDPYWYNYRPWCDERHWDNMGQEVLDSFPTLP